MLMVDKVLQKLKSMNILSKQIQYFIFIFQNQQRQQSRRMQQTIYKHLHIKNWIMKNKVLYPEVDEIVQEKYHPESFGDLLNIVIKEMCRQVSRQLTRECAVKVNGLGCFYVQEESVKFTVHSWANVKQKKSKVTESVQDLNLAELAGWQHLHESTVRKILKTYCRAIFELVEMGKCVNINFFLCELNFKHKTLVVKSNLFKERNPMFPNKNSKTSCERWQNSLSGCLKNQVNLLQIKSYLQKGGITTKKYLKHLSKKF